VVALGRRLANSALHPQHDLHFYRARESAHLVQFAVEAQTAAVHKCNGTWHHLTIGYGTSPPFVTAFEQRHSYRPSGTHRIDWLLGGRMTIIAWTASTNVIDWSLHVIAWQLSSQEVESCFMVNTRPAYRDVEVFLILLCLTSAAVVNVGCSRSTILVDNKTPVTFHLSGAEDVQFFQIATADAVVWRIGPKQSQSLSTLGRIVYGEIPASCLQTIPKNEQAPPLREGVTYTATAVIFDGAPVVVTFSITDGAVVR